MAKASSVTVSAASSAASELRQDVVCASALAVLVVSVAMFGVPPEPSQEGTLPPSQAVAHELDTAHIAGARAAGTSRLGYVPAPVKPSLGHGILDWIADDRPCTARLGKCIVQRKRDDGRDTLNQRVSGARRTRGFR